MWVLLEGNGVWIDAVGAVREWSYVLYTVVIVIIIFVGGDGAGEVDGGTNVTQTRIYINTNCGMVYYLEVSREEVTTEKKRRGYSIWYDCDVGIQWFIANYLLYLLW